MSKRALIYVLKNVYFAFPVLKNAAEGSLQQISTNKSTLFFKKVLKQSTTKPHPISRSDIQCPLETVALPSNIF